MSFLRAPWPMATARATLVAACVAMVGFGHAASHAWARALPGVTPVPPGREATPSGLTAAAWEAIERQLAESRLAAGATSPAPQAGKLQAMAPAEMNRFGWSVAVDGDTAVVGAPLTSEFGPYSGAVYVFVRDRGGPDAWGEVARLTASDASVNPLGNQFGRSVAISGDLIVVGAVGTAAHGEFTGSAYIFERDAGGNAWREVAKLTASDAASHSYFGEAVAIGGDTALVGAPANAGTFPIRGQGSVYVFMRNHGGVDAWGEFQRLTPEDDLAAGFGFSVSVRDDSLVVGAPFTESPSAPLGGLHAGSAYVFQRQDGPPGAWTQKAKLTARDAFFGDVLGWSVAIAGDTVVAGAPSAGATGAAYVFAPNDATTLWQEVVKLSPADADREIRFGYTVSLDGEVAIVGAPDDDEKGGIGSRSGSAYLFGRNAGGTGAWGELLKLTAADGQRTDQFGWDVSISGPTAIVGAPELGADPGGAYVCPLDRLSVSDGACRRAFEVFDDEVTTSGLITSCCANDEFIITATFTNTSDTPVRNPFFEVIELRDGWILKNADHGAGGVGSVLTPDVGDDGLLPGESVVVTFIISLPSREPFWFRVHLRGERDP